MLADVANKLQQAAAVVLLLLSWIPRTQEKNVRWETFCSADSEIVLRRARLALEPPPDVTPAR